MSSTTGQETGGDFYTQKPGSQDTLVQPQHAQTAAEDSKVPTSVQSPSLSRHFQILADTIIPPNTKKDDWDTNFGHSVPSGLLEPVWFNTRIEKVQFVPEVWDHETEGTVEQVMTDLTAHAKTIGSQSQYNPESLYVRKRVGMLDEVVDSIKECVGLNTAASNTTGGTADSPVGHLRKQLNAKLEKTFGHPTHMPDRGYQVRKASGFDRAFNRELLDTKITQLAEADINYAISNLDMAEKSQRYKVGQTRQEGEE